MIKVWKKIYIKSLRIFLNKTMAVIGSYKKKIKSAKNIAKITKAMQLVAASKMKKAQASALSGKEYADGVYSLSTLISKYFDEETNKLAKKVDVHGHQLIVLIAPEKGLCGGLVTNLAKFVLKAIDAEKNSDFLVIGKKAKQIARRFGANVVADFDIGVSSPKYELVPPIARIIENRFISGANKSVKVIYSEFINTMEQSPKSKMLLPLVIDNEAGVNDEHEDQSDYKFEPSIDSIANPLFEMYLETEIYQLLLESYASEQSARMVAMKNATDNANGLISELTVEFNKVRQSAITNELLDIQNAVSII